MTTLGDRRSTSAPARLPGLDGIRAVAVLGVLLYHLDLAWIPGGFLGVDVFFVLSGFLITSLLLKEVEREGRLDWRAFYRRRARRLLPALALMLVGVAVLALLFVHDAAPRLRLDTLATLAYVSNWWLIVNKESYFEFTGRPPLLQHLWSLAIEEQFYLVWPLTAVVLCRFRRRRGIVAASMAIAIGSTAWMAHLSILNQLPQGGDPSRVYFGTDTHSMGLLVGAALAALWSPWDALPARSVWSSHGFTWSVGAASLVAILASFIFVGEFSAPLYRGGFLAISIVAGLLIVASSRVEPGFGTMLGAQPLRWVGERSYGLYVWHWPVFMVTRPALDTPDLGTLGALLRVALTAVVTEISYTFVEQPIRDGAIGRFMSTWRSTSPDRRKPLRRQAVAIAVPVAALVVALAVGLFRTPAPAQQVAADVAEAMGIDNGGPTSVAIARAPSGSIVLASMAPAGNAVPSITNPRTEIGDIALPATVVLTGDNTVTAIGDSVLLGARFELERSIAGARTDAEVGRQASGIFTRLVDLRHDELLAPIVLVHLGTNGFVTEAQLRETLASLSDRRSVIVVNAHAPRRWVDPNNTLIRTVAPEYPNVAVADWAHVSDEHPEYFASDGVHLTKSGQQAFVGEVIRAGHLPSATPPVLAKTRATPVAPEPPRAPVNDMEPAALSAPTEAGSDTVQASDSITDDRSRQIMKAPGLGPLVRHRRPFAQHSYWDAMARCESGGNWSDGGQFSGGLGIYNGSWRAWGGLEFAPTPDAATREQQIIVADRISTQGWRRPDKTFIGPVGFSGWGCAKTIDPPQLVRYDPDSVLLQRFKWHQSGPVVGELQMILGAPRTGTYDQATWDVHLRTLEARRLPRRLAP